MRPQKTKAPQHGFSFASTRRRLCAAFFVLALAAAMVLVMHLARFERDAKIAKGADALLASYASTTVSVETLVENIRPVGDRLANSITSWRNTWRWSEYLRATLRLGGIPHQENETLAVEQIEMKDLLISREARGDLKFETLAQCQERLARWHLECQRLANLSDEKPHMRYTFLPAIPVPLRHVGLLYRSATRVTPNLLVVNFLMNPNGNHDWKGMSEFVSRDEACRVENIIIMNGEEPHNRSNNAFARTAKTIATCRCRFVYLEADRHIGRGRAENMNSPRVVCYVEKISSGGSWTLREGDRLVIGASPSQRMIVPIEWNQPQDEERRARRTTTAERSTHLCSQGIFWYDKVLSMIPSYFLSTWVDHHSRLGISDVHFFTNSNFMGEAIMNLELSPKTRRNTVIHLHETALPPLTRDPLSYEFEPGYQIYVGAECAALAKAMSASWLVVSDFDEFLFPSVDYKSKPHELVMEIPDVGTYFTRYNAARHNDTVIWIRNYIMHIDYCAPYPGARERERVVAKPGSYVNFLNHAVFGYQDVAASNGRRKLAMAMDFLREEDFAHLFVWIHHVFGVKQSEGDAGFAHVRHFRRMFDVKHACAHTEEGAVPPNKTVTMADHGPQLAPKRAELVRFSDADLCDTDAKISWRRPREEGNRACPLRSEPETYCLPYLDSVYDPM